MSGNNYRYVQTINNFHIAGSAKIGEDFSTRIRTLILFLFDGTPSIGCLQVRLKNDDIFEGTEEFTVIMLYPGFGNLSTTTFAILDDECELKCLATSAKDGWV